MSTFKSLNGNGLWAQRRLEILRTIERLGGRAETKTVFNGVSALDEFAMKGPQESEQKSPEDYFKNALRKALDLRFVETADGLLILTELGREEVIHAVDDQ